ncbi:transposase [Mesorhizobium tianshanense]|uniref:transposase n=1 Tax=Mesorhizobium tianshanense TaxID=39844 RepID=UPI0011A27488|nr:transposase [Mesorhizobium tianshanense]
MLDNVGFHKGERAAELVPRRGAWLLFLPPCSPDLAPIEMAFLKLKALLRKKAARTSRRSAMCWAASATSSTHSVPKLLQNCWI